MQRQAVPLLRPERPLVGTGLESQVARDSGMVPITKVNGTVSYVDANEIVVKDDDDNEHFLLSSKISEIKSRYMPKPKTYSTNWRSSYIWASFSRWICM